MRQPEELYDIRVTNELVSVFHPDKGKQEILWIDIDVIKMITTDQGPFQPDVWIGLYGKNGQVLLPQGAIGYDEVYDIISKYERFSFDNVISAAGCTDNKEFLLWTRV